MQFQDEHSFICIVSAIVSMHIVHPPSCWVTLFLGILFFPHLTNHPNQLISDRFPHFLPHSPSPFSPLSNIGHTHTPQLFSARLLKLIRNLNPFYEGKVLFLGIYDEGIGGFWMVEKVV